MAKRKPLTINEWMILTGTTNRELERLTEKVDPEGRGVCESSIRGIRKGFGCHIRVVRLLVEASKTKPARIEGMNCWIWWETLYSL